MELPGYAELHCLSNFTFLRGASHPEELVRRASELGYGALAITDECSMAGIVRAHVAAKACGLKLIAGTEMLFDERLKLVLLATNRESYGQISMLISRARRRSGKGSYQLNRDDLSYNLDHCLALLLPGDPADADTARFVAQRFVNRAWIAVELLHGTHDRARLQALQALGRECSLPLMAAGDVHMHLRSRKALQDTLAAIRLRTPLHAAGIALHANAERHLRSRLRLTQIYPAALLAETLRIAERCDFSLDSLRYEFPAELVPAGETPGNYLRRLSIAGLQRRYPEGAAAAVRLQVERELALIAELGYEHFFLTVQDIVAYARANGILCQGRGSAANSAVCYCLGITEVDPARMNLLFERFISRERDEPPDIDVDFEHQRREEVIQYIYRRYGRGRAALAAAVITYRPRSALRDIGKALGLESSIIERLTRSMMWWDGHRAIPERLRETGIDPDSPAMQRLIRLTAEIIGFPRHLSQHVGGFVIAGGPLERLVPVENAAMPERTIIQWDKDDLEALGLLKVDVLALGMLSAIRRTLEFIHDMRGTALTMQDILDRGDDQAVYAMIQRADTTGVFQIESRAQMSMLPRLKPAGFYDLVIEVAIVRPGPIQGGMVHPYLRRRNGLELVNYPSEAVRHVLERTLGVPIFQEQVMQLAVVAAGFTPGEADQLRRSMAAWKRKGGLEHFQPRLIAGMLKRGYSRQFAEQIYQQICGFGEYGFPESHSASFALLAYVSAWLKHHEPAAFLAGMLNAQPLGFYTASQLVQDARRHGVEVRPVDVNHSALPCTLEPGTDQPAVRLGLSMIKGLHEQAAVRIVAARQALPFTDTTDLARRAQLDPSELRRLADAGALASLAGHRRQAHWEAAGISPETGLNMPVIEVHQPALPPPSEGLDIVCDYASLGLTLGRHPLSLLRQRLQRLRLVTAADLCTLADGSAARTAGIVTCRQRPGTAGGVMFVTLEDETGCINVVVWRQLIERQRRELLQASLLGVEGMVQKEGAVVHLVAHRLTDHSALLGRLATTSRNFH
ncbi:MAG: error-prone DNA polymerase [Betaproteobacteria bacterium]|jgi:error-prone DNA polymerase|nr:error-prone DNA polymerase [Betaproteobacteria bacterium]MDH4293614.1 error-prone DNA polymerase [Betaproteobacteria bacterium]